MGDRRTNTIGGLAPVQPTLVPENIYTLIVLSFEFEYKRDQYRLWKDRLKQSRTIPEFSFIIFTSVKAKVECCWWCEWSSRMVSIEFCIIAHNALTA